MPALLPMVARGGPPAAVAAAQMSRRSLCAEHKSGEDRGVTSLTDLTGSLGAGLLTVAVPGPPGAQVDDITLAEPAQGILGQPRDLLLGVGCADLEAAVELVARAGERGASGVVLRRSLARRRAVRDGARRSGTALLELAEHASWAHIVWLLRGVLDRAGTRQQPGRADAPVHDDLFALADAAAALVDAPVTIEDAQSRVLAYSSRQDVTDPARVSTIVGRRVPEEVLASLRARGVFRRMTRSAEAFFVPPFPEGGTRGRFVVPVRAGGEWLGSIWAVVDAAPRQAVERELVQSGSVVALHLLRLRAQADLSRRLAVDRLRGALTGTAADAEGWLPPGPWRVVALGPAEEGAQAVDLWESACRRRSWHQPLLADLHGRPYAVVRADGAANTPGTWAWLRAVVGDVSTEDGRLTAAAGAPAATPAGLPRSQAEALEADRARRHRASAALEEVWAEVTVERAAAALQGREPAGPLTALREHDELRGTDYLATLAAWLDHPGEPSRAARAIHVHPNTLRYRMQRISGLAVLDLDDPVVRLAVRLQLLALLDRPGE